MVDEKTAKGINKFLKGASNSTLQELDAYFGFGEKLSGKAIKSIESSGITLQDVGNFYGGWSQYTANNGVKERPRFTDLTVGGAFRMQPASDPNAYISSLGYNLGEQGERGRKGGQGARPDEYNIMQGPAAPQDRGPFFPPNAGPQPRSELFASTAQESPFTVGMNQQEYERYLQGMTGVNELRSAVGMQPASPFSLNEINRGMPTIQSTASGGQERILPTPQERTQQGLGYFGDRMAGPQMPSMGANDGPQRPMQPNEGPQRPMQPNEGPQMPQGAFNVGQGVVSQTPPAQVGRAATQAPQYESALNNMMGVASAPAVGNAPPQRVTGPRPDTAMIAGGIGAASGAGSASGLTGGATGGMAGTGGRSQAGGTGNVFAIESQNPQAYRDETEARRSAMQEAMRTGQPMVLTGENFFVGNQASRQAGGQGAAQISGPYNSQMAAQAREYNQRVNAAAATGQPLPSQTITPPSGAAQSGQSFGGLTGEDLIFAAQQRAFGRQSGITAGAGNPQENADRYQAIRERMITAQDQNRQLSTAGRAEAREQRGAERAAMVAAAGVRDGGRGRSGEQQEPSLKPLELTPEQKRTQSNYTRSFTDIGSQTAVLFEGMLDEKNPQYKLMTDDQKKAAQEVVKIFKSQDYKDFVGDFTSLISTDDAQRRAFTDMMSKADTPEKKSQEIIKLFNQWRISNRPEGF
jgi:hypothetical protein